MIDLRRREFLFGAAASLVLRGKAKTGPRIYRAIGSAVVGKPLPEWHPGELELHFVYTGRGENMLYVLPDGTSVVNDVGDYWREEERAEIPWLPSAERLGGDCMADYVIRRLKRPYVDYLLLSHWHSDHAGDPACGTRKAADGRDICGIPLFNESVGIGVFIDHQYPRRGQYGGGDVESRVMIEEWLAAKRIRQEPFRVGALGQIALKHDPDGRYAGTFSVRNVCANAVCWTGRDDETVDYGAIHVKATGKNEICNQNILSMGFVMRYGNFSYWCGGDVSSRLVGMDGKSFDYEAVVGRVAGPVTVCKTNHHAFSDAMHEGFVREMKAAAYVSNVWCPLHIQDSNMRLMTSRTLYPGERMVFPTLVPKAARKSWPDSPWWADTAPGGHVVIKVAPGGETYRIFTVDAAKADGTVTGEWMGVSGVT